MSREKKKFSPRGATMKKLIFAALVLSIAFTGCLVISGNVEPEGDFLATAELSFRQEWTTIVIPEREHRFHRLSFRDVSQPVEVYKVVVLYRDGGRDTMDVHWRFMKGHRVRTIQLRQGRRVVDRVFIYYRVIKGYESDRATVRIFGVF
jgi:hypothetical protein